MRKKEGDARWLAIITAVIAAAAAITVAILDHVPGRLWDLAFSRTYPASKKLVSDVTASSTLQPEWYEGRQRKYDPPNIKDDSEATAWVAAGRDDDIGQWVKLTFSEKVVVSSISIVGAYGADENRFQWNNRLKKVQLCFPDSSHNKVFTLADSRDCQKLTLDRPVTTLWLRIVILEVYPGTKYRDTPISEIYFP
jgi:hypothetical protein